MKLYYSPGACSLATHIVLEEAGAPYEAVKLNLREGEQRKPEYLKLNWKSKVPALQLDSGEVLTENPVIMAYVADQNAPGKLLAGVGDLRRARAQEWLAWCASFVQPAFGPLFGPQRFADDPAALATLKQKATATLTTILQTFADHLKGPYVLGSDFTIADAYTLVFYRWAQGNQIAIPEGLRAAARTLLARPAVKRTIEQEGLTVEA